MIDYENLKTQFINKVNEKVPQLYLCFNCYKCTLSCPNSSKMQIPPHQLIKLVQLQELEILLESNTLWICNGCNSCFIKCPNEIKHSEILDILRETFLPILMDKKLIDKDVLIFHKSFIDFIKKWDIQNELYLGLKFALKTGKIRERFSEALKMFKKGYLKPEFSPVKRIFKRNISKILKE